MPPHAELLSVVTTDAWAYAVVGRQVRRKGHLISAGSRNPGGLLKGGSHGGRQHQSSQSMARKSPGR
jgi:hypothetical protein